MGKPTFDDAMAPLRPLALLQAREAAAHLIAKDMPKAGHEAFVSLISRLAAARAAEDYLLASFAKLKVDFPQHAPLYVALESIAASIAGDLGREFKALLPPKGGDRG